VKIFFCQPFVKNFAKKGSGYLTGDRPSVVPPEADPLSVADNGIEGMEHGAGRQLTARSQQPTATILHKGYFFLLSAAICPLSAGNLPTPNCRINLLQLTTDH